MYRWGNGTSKDLVAAYMWWDLARAQGDAHAAKDLAPLARDMTKQQIAEAQNRVAKWKEKHPGN